MPQHPSRHPSPHYAPPPMYPSPPTQTNGLCVDHRTANCRTGPHTPTCSDGMEIPLPSFTLDSSDSVQSGVLTPSLTLDYGSYSRTPSPALTPAFTPTTIPAQLQLPSTTRERSVSQPSPSTPLNSHIDGLSRPKSMTLNAELMGDCRFDPELGGSMADTRSLPDYAAQDRQLRYTLTS